MAAAFYTMSDERFFLGAVGLVNSLRLVGHSEPIYLLDCGLSDAQRELLAPHAELVPVSERIHPLMLKTIAPLAHPAEAMVLIDADMIVTRPLTELAERAAAGSVLAVVHGRERFCPDWGGLLDLGPVEPRGYVSAGLLFLGGALGREVLGLVDGLLERVDFERSFWRRNEASYPFLYGDQDVWNAVLASSRAPADRVVRIERRLEAIPPFAGLRVLDEATLRCAYPDGAEPYLLHHYTVKPWLELTLEGVYSRLLRRLLGARDVAIRVPRGSLPRHLRSGYLGAAVRRRGDGRGRFHSYVRAPLSLRLRAFRDRLAG
jgi:hypothetical protein